MSSVNSSQEACDHPGCSAKIEITRQSHDEVPDIWIYKAMEAIGWLLIYKDGRVIETYCPDCRARYKKLGTVA
jgi:hypothetical protein